jgi:hypothetical protein
MLGAIMMAMSLAAAAHRQMRQRAFGAGEVDQDLGVLQAGAQVGHDGHAAGSAEEGGGIAAERRAARDVEGTGQAAVLGLAHRLDQHVAHAPGGAGNGDAAQRRRGGRRGIGHAREPS